MATNLELITSVTGGTGLSSYEVDNVFSNKYDVYYINFLAGYSTTGYYNMRFLDSVGSPITTSTYDHAKLVLIASGSFSENKSTSDTLIQRVNYTYQNAYGGNTGFYIFNPYSSSYTFMTFQNGFESVGTMYGLKGIAVEKTAQTVRGIQILPNLAVTFDNPKVNVYGVK